MGKRKKIKRYQLKRKYKKFIKAQMERKVLREFYLITEKDANMMSLYLPPLAKTDYYKSYFKRIWRNVFGT